jgi:PAS domain S-box-containing protein
VFQTIVRDINERRQAEEALRANEEKYRGIFDESITAIYVFDTKKSFINSNQAGLDLLGYSREELMHMSIPDVDADPLAVLPAHQELFDGGRLINYEHKLRRKDGKIITVLNNSRPLTDANGNMIGMLSTLIDITERKKVEKKLKESEELFKNLFLFHAAVKLIIDPDTGSIMDANEAAVRYYGWSHEQITHMKIQDINTCPSEEVKVAMEDVKARKRASFEFRHRRADGSVRDVEVFSTNIKVQGKDIFHTIVHDITERKGAEEKLKQSQLLNEAIISSVPGLLYLFDNTGHIIQWNKQAEKITGYSFEEIKAKYIFDWFGDFEPDKSNIKNGINEVMTKGYSSTEAHLITKDGNRIPWFFTGVKLNIAGKDHLLGIGIDITERKKAEEELERYHQHLEELVRERTTNLEASNKELEAFSYSASHDLRAPLRSIDGFSQALLEDCWDKLDIQGKDYLIRIKAASKRMADLIEDMLQLSRITRMEMNIEKVDLTRIARSVIDELQKSQPRRNVEIRIAEGLEDTADLRLMRIVLDNLLSNAWKFTERQAKAKVEFGLWKMEDTRKVYFIRDNGAGFDMAYADKLFAPFQRLHADDEFPGTGIGLATVRRIINRHGGRIRAEGKIDKGATFYFSINEK